MDTAAPESLQKANPFARGIAFRNPQILNSRIAFGAII
jgi:hypothetical protein